MSRLDPTESFEALKTEVTSAISEQFPQEGRKHVLELEGIDVVDNISSDDVNDQADAKLKGKTFGVPIKANLVLKDKVSGKVIDRRRMTVAEIPKITNRFSYIVRGSEYQVDNQFRLRPGAYTKVRQDGGLETFFNVKGTPLRMEFDPKSRQFNMKHGGAKPPLYPIMRAVGFDDSQLRGMWGDEILKANQTDSRGRPVKVERKAIEFAQRLNPKAEISSFSDAADVIKTELEAKEMHPDSTKITLGKPIKTITPEAMGLAAGRLLGVARGEQKPDVRDSLRFKDLNGIEDFLGERVRQNTKRIKAKIANNIDRKTSIRDIVAKDTINRPLREFFSQSSLASTTPQTNPLRMISGQMRTTITGEGGITESSKVSEEAKLVDPSHFGVLDPLHTPEGSSTGITLQMAIGAKKVGKNLAIPLINVKTGKPEYVEVAKVHDSIVAMPDAVRRKGNKWVPREGKTVRASVQDNEMRDVPMDKVQYIVPKAAQMFSLGSNQVPFIASDSPNRATMSGRHQEQAVSLVHREAPHVRSMLGDTSFGDLMGQFAAQHAPVAGEVVSVKDGEVVLKGRDGKKRSVQLYNHYPTNDKKGQIHATPVVKPGDSVKAGQLIADTNYTQGGTYAPGTNLKVGYTPWKGLTFEDAVVISESAAKKLTSNHLHKKAVVARDATVEPKKRFHALFSAVKDEQTSILGDDGVAVVGSTVKPGAVLVAASADRKLTTEQKKLSLINKSLVSPKQDKSVTWDEDVTGKVVGVHRVGDKVEVHVETNEPMEVGDKLAGLHGNKGIVSAILQDHEMPQSSEGPIHLLMNPIGIAGRMNVGQVLETAASKIAKKTGRPYTVQNFENDNNHAEVKAALRANGLSDTEDLTNPTTGRPIKNVLTGDQYIVKLEHQVGKKMAARDRAAYDHNLVPRGGGKEGAQAFGSLGLYAMLAHGARANLRESQTWLGDRGQSQKDEFWAALQAGELLPPPRPTFADKKFHGYLKTLGVNVEQDGNSLNLVPMTDKQVLGMSNGELNNGGRLVIMKNGKMKPEKGGLFDEKITGGVDGTDWGHLRLTQRMPNPLFETAIRSLVGVRKPEFNRILSGEVGVKDGKVVSAETKGATLGPKAVTALVDTVNVDKELEREEKRVGNLRDQAQNESRRRIKYLRALKKAKLTPGEAYTVQNVPVMPPSMRPIALMEDGSLQNDDLNELYKGLALVDGRLKALSESKVRKPESILVDKELSVYDHLKALSGLGGSLNKKHPGIMEQISGKQGKGPKSSFVQDTLIKKKRDMSGRSTIVPDPSLSVDEVGIPREMGRVLYRPFVVRELRQAMNIGTLEAKEMINNDDPMAQKALEKVIQDRPLLLKRDPALHKFNVQGFKPRLVGGKAIKIPHLVTSGFNADFDGDSMSAYIPVSDEAKREAYDMMPSNNLFSPSSGKLAFAPTHEMQVGLFMATEVGKKTGKKFADVKALKKAVAKGDVEGNDVVDLGGTKTTLYRAELDSKLPAKLRGGKLLTDMSYRLKKKDQGALFERVAHEGETRETARAINSLKDVGNHVVNTQGFSFNLDDFDPHDDVRKPIVAEAERKLARVDRSTDAGEQRVVDTYERVMEKMEAGVQRKAERIAGRSALAKLQVAAGIKGNGYRQLTASPGLFVDGAGEVVPNPVNRSYAEGLRSSDYWSSMSGGRKGIVQKVQSVAKPGYFTKMMTNAVIDTMVDTDDCETDHGISLSVDEPDVQGRFLTADTKLSNGKTFKAGTLVTPAITTAVRNDKKDSKLVVRSPMRCKHTDGICAKCMGVDVDGNLPAKGTNVGVIAAQSLGERGTQMALKSFHSGGVYGGRREAEKSITAGGLDRALDLLYLPRTVKGSATLAEGNGTVRRITSDVAGGVNVDIDVGRGKSSTIRSHYIPSDRRLIKKLRPGARVRAGDPISSGPVNPHELLPLAGVAKTQGHLAKEIHDLYGSQGVKRRHAEILVRAVSGATKVKDPGDNRSLLPGDYTTTMNAAAWNAKNKTRRPVVHTPVLRGVQQIPLDVSEDWLARMNHERLKNTVIEGAQQGWSSDLHGRHPIPSLVHGIEFGRGTPEKPHHY